MACRFLIILVQDNQRGDDARHPAAEREQKHDEHRPAAAVDHRQRREDNGQDDLEAGHGCFLFCKSTKIMPKTRYCKTP